ncbi:hypothetical protein AQUCO_00600368v1 [Aquilegia coerulea]|uniref:dolichol kinase n=1 Tax=Aquilegia coerulea TaxID=218851 RepID=A0A2G5EPA7_AQUCA|nr:hypothetical protein AQUCO_00600368v1 [Aquilegia coerulea]
MKLEAHNPTSEENTVVYSCTVVVCVVRFHLEILAENSSTSFSIQFKTRPGVSSRILLAVDIHHSSEIGGYLILQYWAVSASCFGVLVFLGFTLRPHAHGTKIINMPYGVSYAIIVYAAISYLSLATNSSDLHVVLKLLWVFCHGMAAVKLFLHILHTFPLCASPTADLVLYLGDMLAYTLIQISSATLISSKLVSPQYGMKKNEISTIIQGVMAGLLIFPILYKFILRTCGYATKYLNGGNFATDGDTSIGVRRSLIFYGSLALILLVVVPAWMQNYSSMEIWPLGKHIHYFMNAFTGHRDSDLLIVSHFSLLMGSALPKWMSSGFNVAPSTGYVISQHWLSLLFAITVSGLLEAYTAQLDNVFIPQNPPTHTDEGESSGWGLGPGQGLVGCKRKTGSVEVIMEWIVVI